MDALLHDDRVRVVSFTGSTEVGRKLLQAAADNILTPAMELGGNAPFVVFEDADIDAAVSGAIIAKMRNMGEACTAANRFYVHDKVHDAFAKKLADKMGAMKIGNGLEEGVEVGSLVNAETRDKVVELVDDAVKRGAKVLTGGSIRNGPGYFYQPTVLVDVPDDARCFHEEIFGPVAAIARFSDEEDALKRCNATEYGLVAYVFTEESEARAGFLRKARFRHDRPEPRARLRSGGALRRHEAIRHRPRGRASRHHGVPRDPVHLGRVVERDRGDDRAVGILARRASRARHRRRHRHRRGDRQALMPPLVRTSR